MEATERSVGNEIALVDSQGKPLSETSRKVLEVLGNWRSDRHMTVARIADAAGCDGRGVGPVLASLTKKRMIVQRENRSTGEVSWHLPTDLAQDEKREPETKCLVKGCGFIAHNDQGLRIHTGRVHKSAPGESIEDLKREMKELRGDAEDHQDDEEEDDDPEVLEQAGPDVAEILKAFERGANEIRKLGWQVVVQVKLDYPPMIKPGAS